MEKEMAKTKNEKLTKVTLKLIKKHPRKQMRHGSHIVETVPRSFNLTEKELADLDSVGPKHWIGRVSDSAAVAREDLKKDMTPSERMQVELKKLGVDLAGTETLNQLEELMVEHLNK